MVLIGICIEEPADQGLARYDGRGCTMDEVARPAFRQPDCLRPPSILTDRRDRNHLNSRSDEQTGFRHVYSLRVTPNLSSVTSRK